MIIRIVGHSLKLIVTPINESGTNDTTNILLSLTVEREHHLGMVCMRVPSTISIADYKLARSKQLVVHIAFACPRTRQMTHPNITPADRQHG